jgi:hypothetical protein
VNPYPELDPDPVPVGCEAFGWIRRKKSFMIPDPGSRNEWERKLLLHADKIHNFSTNDPN